MEQYRPQGVRDSWSIFSLVNGIKRRRRHVYVTPESTFVESDSIIIINVYIGINIDTSDSFHNQIIITSSSEDTTLIYVNASYKKGIVITHPIYITFVHTAYPNPVSGLVVLNFSLRENCELKYKIINKNGDEVRSLIDMMCIRGRHSIYWDLKDNNGNRVKPELYRAIFKTESYEVFGDIQVSE